VDAITIADYERAAAALLDRGTYDYYAGGANDELTLAENVAAYGRLKLRPRVLVDVDEPSTATTVLGRDLSLPVLIAPVAFQKMANPEGEVATARAAAAAGTIMCLSTFATSTFADVAAAAGPRWFQLYVPRDPGLQAETLAAAAEHGYEALILTVDTPVLGRRERDLRTTFTIPHVIGLEWAQAAHVTPRSIFDPISPSITWKDLDRLASLSGMPIVLKGVVTAEDAHLACEHGAAAVVVSNHGGRQLDGAAATIESLPEVAEAVDGRIEVLLDGGIRRGTDVLKALALGARAVLIGRPMLWGLTVGGEEGVRHVLELLRDELSLALQLVGCRTPADVTRAHVT
jgi:isopentenyl diphosphate isomerase/L-lactate dehydrogenase-like FMN-dependent dehydrogenase